MLAGRGGQAPVTAAQVSMQPSHVPVILGIADELPCTDDLLLPLCATTLCGGTGG